MFAGESDAKTRRKAYSSYMRSRIISNGRISGISAKTALRRAKAELGAKGNSNG